MYDWLADVRFVYTGMFEVYVIQYNTIQYKLHVLPLVTFG